MKAQETKSDWSTAEIKKTTVLFSAPNNYVIDEVDLPSFVEVLNLVDTDHKINSISVTGLATNITYIGDVKGSDIGKTSMTVTYTPFKVTTREQGDCISGSRMALASDSTWLSPQINQIVKADTIVARYIQN